MTPPLAAALRHALAARADQEVAARQFMYMKGVQVFRGVKAPERRALLRDGLSAHPVKDFEAYAVNVRELWQGKFREERYLALDVALRLKRFVTPEALPLFETMLAECDWWDVLDPLAADLLGRVLRGKHALLKRNVRRWRRSEHPWTRRAALLVQLKHRHETDVELMEETVLVLAPETDFFIRKAIGWVLRQHARTDPQRVRRFLREHRHALPALSRREATRGLERP